MSQSAKTSKNVGSIRVQNTATFNNVRLTRASVTQGTSITSGVTNDSPAGFIFTFTTGSIATSGTSSFTVTSSAVQADSIVFANLVNYLGAGIPVTRVNTITQGSFGITLRNLDATNAISGSMKLAYSVL